MRKKKPPYHKLIQAVSRSAASHNLPVQVTKKAWKNLPPREEKCLNKKINPAGESRNAGLKQAGVGNFL